MYKSIPVKVLRFSFLCECVILRFTFLVSILEIGLGFLVMLGPKDRNKLAN